MHQPSRCARYPIPGLDLRYADTDEHDLGKTYGSHFTAAIKASF